MTLNSSITPTGSPPANGKNPDFDARSDEELIEDFEDSRAFDPAGSNGRVRSGTPVLPATPATPDATPEKAPVATTAEATGTKRTSESEKKWRSHTIAELRGKLSKDEINHLETGQPRIPLTNMIFALEKAGVSDTTIARLLDPRCSFMNAAQILSFLLRLRNRALTHARIQPKAELTRVFVCVTQDDADALEKVGMTALHIPLDPDPPPRHYHARATPGSR